MKQPVAVQSPPIRLKTLFAGISKGQVVLLLAVASWLAGSVLLLSAWQATRLVLRQFGA